MTDQTCRDMRVLVTAGAAGIGRAIAGAFVAAGARIAVCDIDDAALAEFRQELPGHAAFECDVSSEDEVAELFEDVAEHLGGLDVLVNNAGIAGPTGPVESLSLEDWRRTMEVNVEAQFLCVRRAVPMLRASGGGAIVNLSSAAGKFGFAHRTPYSSSKWAVVGFTKSLAIELGPDNIRVNAVLPGAVDGPRIRRVIEAKAKSTGIPLAEMEKLYTRQASLGRMVDADDIARMVVFLAGPGGRNISGQALSIDGDTQALV
ncbi:MAG: SDR family oxidoreductase [Alphaproteobacteria bacterium]|nr:SDR family oxidoreductase [Alphaproteobacteria bacterium]